MFLPDKQDLSSVKQQAKPRNNDLTISRHNAGNNGLSNIAFLTTVKHGAQNDTLLRCKHTLHCLVVV